MMFLLTSRHAVRMRRCRRAALAGALLLAQAMWAPAALARAEQNGAGTTVAEDVA